MLCAWRRGCHGRGGRDAIGCGGTRAGRGHGGEAKVSRRAGWRGLYVRESCAAKAFAGRGRVGCLRGKREDIWGDPSRRIRAAWFMEGEQRQLAARGGGVCEEGFRTAWAFAGRGRGGLREAGVEMSKCGGSLQTRCVRPHERRAQRYMHRFVTGAGRRGAWGRGEGIPSRGVCGEGFPSHRWGHRAIPRHREGRRGGGWTDGWRGSMDAVQGRPQASLATHGRPLGRRPLPDGRGTSPQPSPTQPNPICTSQQKLDTRTRKNGHES